MMRHITFIVIYIAIIRLEYCYEQKHINIHVRVGLRLIHPKTTLIRDVCFSMHPRLIASFLLFLSLPFSL